MEPPLRSISYKRHRFPADVIRHAVWLYYRFTLSYRDVEELLAQRGIEVSYETIRCWTLKFGPQIAANLRRRRCLPTGRWQLDGWMRCTSGSADKRCGCGGPWTTRAKSWMSWSRNGATDMLPGEGSRAETGLRSSFADCALGENDARQG